MKERQRSQKRIFRCERCCRSRLDQVVFASTGLPVPSPRSSCFLPNGASYRSVPLFRAPPSVVGRNAVAREMCSSHRRHWLAGKGVGDPVQLALDLVHAPHPRPGGVQGLVNAVSKAAQTRVRRHDGPERRPVSNARSAPNSSPPEGDSSM
jgi:hypothetical protein